MEMGLKERHRWMVLVGWVQVSKYAIYLRLYISLDVGYTSIKIICKIEILKISTVISLEVDKWIPKIIGSIVG